MSSSSTERRFLLALDSVGDGVWDWDMQTDKVYYSPRWKALLGYADEDIADTFAEWRRLVVPADASMVMAAVRAHADRGDPYTVEFRMLCKDGSIKWLLGRGKVVERDPTGRPLRMIGTNTDITERKLAEERLRWSEEQLRLLLDSTAEGIFGVDMAGNCTFSNSACLRLLGYQHASDLLGQDMHALIAHRRADGRPYPKADCPIVKGLITATSATAEDDVFWTKGGASFPVQYWSFPMLRENQPIGAVVTFVDTTERKRAKQALEQGELLLRLFVQHTPAAVAMFDRDMRYVLASERWTTDYKLDGRNLIGRSHYEVFPDVPDEWKLIHQRCLAGESVAREEDPFPRADGTLEWLAWTVLPWRDTAGTIGGVIMFSQVITERKRIAAELRALNADLEQRVAARTADLAAAREAAEAASRAKSTFLANMSHEIRTPMNAVLGMAYLALRNERDPGQRDYLEKIQAGAQGLLGVLNDVLDFSRIEAGRLVLEAVPFQLEPVIESVISVVSVKAEEKRLELLYAKAHDVPDALLGDPLRLRQVLINLVTNAVKFTDRGEVVIAAALQARAGDQVLLRFSVRDTGIGLSPAQRERIFNSFTQADESTTRRYGGSGLGLAISRQLVQLMKGEIQVESVEGAGSSFSFTAQFGVRANLGQAPSVLGLDPAAVRVLVVDDNESARDLLQTYLRELGFLCDAVDSGETALLAVRDAATAGQHPFNVILLDWRMPGLNGLETAVQMRQATPDAPAPTIIMVTAYGREEIRRRAQEIGIAGFLVKPVSRSSLFDAIVTALGRGREGAASVVAGTPLDLGATALQGVRLVLAEDNEINQLVGQGILESWGAQVDIAHDGHEAVALVASAEPPYDAVLMDLQMPGMDGYEAARQIRANPRTRNVPIVAMTADAFESERQRCFDVGMDDHVAKPIEPAHLRSVLVRCLRPHGLHRPMARNGSSSSARPAGPQALDVAGALRRMNGNRALLLRLLEAFDRDWASAPAQIRDAVGRGDLAAARGQVHTLVGVAGNLSALTVQSVAGAIDEALRTGEVARAQSLMSPLAAAMEEAIQAVQNLRDPVPGA